ncbi:MAG: ankX 2 [Phycisphaerales bacterium]|nr:ankX 2 [Phycisphaerales bacterium]
MWVVSPTHRVGRYVATIGATYEVIHPGISTSLPLHQRLRHASLRATARGPANTARGSTSIGFRNRRDIVSAGYGRTVEPHEGGNDSRGIAGYAHSIVKLRMKIPAIGILTVGVLCCGCMTRAPSQSAMPSPATAGPSIRAVASARDSDALILAADAGDMQQVIHLLSRKNVEVNATISGRMTDYPEYSPVQQICRMKWTALHAAAKEHQLLIVLALIRAGANLEARDSCGRTALSLAVERGGQAAEETAIALIEAKADPNVRTLPCLDGPSRETPLHRAVGWREMRVVKALIAAGADANAETSRGETPLDYVRHPTRQREIAKLLIEAGGKRNFPEADVPEIDLRE